MKKISGILCTIFMITFMQALNETKVFAEDSGKSLTIIFTHDLHDHFVPFKVKEEGKTLEVGGYERLKTAIDEERLKSDNSILVDAGDFSMGTLFQSIYASDAPELRVLGEMGYDAVTLGNHEFDFRDSGLKDSLNNAVKSNTKLPTIVQSNMKFPKENKSLLELKKSMKNYGVKDYTVIEKDGVKIGIFGLMGKDAAIDSPMTEVEFSHIVNSSKEIVKKLKEEEKVDLIVCLSHSGTDEDKSKSEDEILAKKVPDINVIISGHTHTTLEKPIIVGNTIIGSSGEYGQNLGVIKISKKGKKDWKLEDYKLREIDSSINKNYKVTYLIKEFKDTVQKKYLDKFGMKFDEVLAKSDFDFVDASKIGDELKEEPLGNLISDSYIYAVKKAEGENYEKVSAAVIPVGTIRGSLVKGDITVSDVFTMNSLGIGEDKKAGYPLVSVYLTGKELKTISEVDASITPMMSGAQLYVSGMKYTFNPNRLLFNKITDCKLQNEDGTLKEIYDKKLYRVVAGLYCAQMLYVVGEKSYGLLSLVPKDKEGNPITNFEKYIVLDGKSEVKEWRAVAEYMKSFDKVDGVAKIPDYYKNVQGRKNIDNDKSVTAFLTHPNNIALAFYGIVVVVCSVGAFGTRKIFKKVKETRNVNFLRS